MVEQLGAAHDDAAVGIKASNDHDVVAVERRYAHRARAELLRSGLDPHAREAVGAADYGSVRQHDAVDGIALLDEDFDGGTDDQAFVVLIDVELQRLRLLTQRRCATM